MTEPTPPQIAATDARMVDCLQTLATSVTGLAVAVRADSPGVLLTADELAERFRIPARTIKDQASAGLIPHHRVGKHYRFSNDDIAEILRITKQQPLRSARSTRNVTVA